MKITYNNYDTGFSDNLFPNRGNSYSTGVDITPGHNLDTIAVSHARFLARRVQQVVVHMCPFLGQRLVIHC